MSVKESNSQTARSIYNSIYDPSFPQFVSLGSFLYFKCMKLLQYKSQKYLFHHPVNLTREYVTQKEQQNRSFLRMLYRKEEKSKHGRYETI